MTTTRESRLRRATETASNNSQAKHHQSTDADLWDAMILVDDLHRFGRAWVGALLRMDREQARAALQPMRPGDLTDSRLTIATRAIWHAVQAGDDPEPLSVAQAAYWHGLVPEDSHHVFLAFLVDLSLCEPPRRSTLDAATAPGHMARTLVEVVR